MERYEPLDMEVIRFETEDPITRHICLWRVIGFSGFPRIGVF